MKIKKYRWTILAIPCAFALHGVAVAEPVGKPQPPVPASVAAAVPDFSGIWEMAKLEFVVIPEVSGTLTSEAKAKADLFKSRFDPVIDDPAKVCLIKGMPWTMLTRARNYPVEIYQTPDRIFMTFELYDQFRTIRINGQAKPDAYPPSPSGWSVARWEGNVFVTETTGLPALNEIGPVHRSEEAKITERWSFRDDPQFGRVIDVDMTIEDPSVYATPAIAKQVYRKSDPGVVPGGYNCSSALWDDHIERRKAELKIPE